MKLSRIFLLAILLSAGAARGGELNEKLPGDTLGFVEVDPTRLPGGGGGGRGGVDQTGLVDLGVDTLTELGALPEQAAMVKDVAGLGGVMGMHRWCIGWLDADFSVSANNDLECNSVQVVWLIDTGGKPFDMVQRLTSLLTHVSTQTTAHQQIKSTPEQHLEYVEFHDEKWPPWLTLDWTQRDNIFIVTLGQGAMEHYLSGRAVGGVPWAQTLAAADDMSGRDLHTGVLARVLISPKGFRDRFPQAMQKTVLGSMFSSLDLGNVDSAILTARMNNREITLDTGFLQDGKVTPGAWTENLPANSPLLTLIPKEATAYLILNVRWGDLYERLTALLDASMGLDRPIARIVQEYASRVGVDVRRDLLVNMEPLVVVHDAPLHPLRLPGMVTIVAAAEPGKAELVKGALEKLTGLGRAALEKKAGKRGMLRIRTDADGVSYLQFGLVGPAWTVVEGKLVGSWSPGALRAVLAGVKNVDAGAFENGHK